MKFFEYDLYHTVSKVYEHYEASNLKPRSADWFIYREQRAKLMQDVLDELPKTLLVKDRSVDICTERVLKAWDDFGKNKKKYKTLILIAEASGRGCYCNGLSSRYGPCSDVMTFELFSPEDQLRDFVGIPYKTFKYEVLGVRQDFGGRIICKKHLSVRK